MTANKRENKQTIGIDRCPQAISIQREERERSFKTKIACRRMNEPDHMN